MNCQEALDLLYDYLDKEASEIDVKQVKEHLDNCHTCFEKYKLEEEVQKLINLKMSGDKTVICSERLRESIICKLDKIDEERGVARKRPPFWNATYVLAAAALVVVVIGAAYLANGFYRHHKEFGPLEQAHFSTDNNLATFANSESTMSVLQFASANWHYAVDRSVENYQLVGAHLETVEGVQMAHLVYRSGSGELLSAFLAPSSSFQIPASLTGTKITKGNWTFFDHNCRGCRLLYHREGDVVVVTASTDHQADLFSFIPGKPSI
jgi:mycothiol system anti-sigma-R factor